MTVLCAAPTGWPHCGIRGRHADDCDHHRCGPECACGCTGCQPRPAADGLRLCYVCADRIGPDARKAAVLHADLELQLIRRVGRGERIGFNGAAVPDDAVVAARSAIRATLVGLARVIADERGIGLPVDEVSAIAAYAARHGSWLAAHPAAGEHSRDLRDIATDRRTWKLAYPTGSDRLYIGDCPLPTDDGEACGTRLHQRADELLLTCPSCGTYGAVEWWQQRIAGTPGAVVDAYAAAAHLSARWLRPVDPALIRKWASRGRAEPVSRDDRGRALYRFADLIAEAGRIWGEPVGYSHSA